MLPIVVGGGVVFAVLAVAAPAAFATVAAKEGPLEHVSHVVLLVAAMAWLRAALVAATVTRTERRVAIGLTVTCLVVLGEELDWGGVYGVGSLTNLHNAWSGASYLLFAIPVVVGVGVVGWRNPKNRGRLPRRRDAVGLAVLGVASLALTVLWPAGEAAVDEIGESLLYVGLAWMALRPLHDGGSPPHRVPR